MEYSFEIVGISPVLSFFTHQQQIQAHPHPGAEYLGAYQCTLDAFIESVETLPMRRGWHLDRVVDTVINFWLNNADQVNHWKQRLRDAGAQNLLIARVADLDSLRAEFEFLLGDDF
jgi:plasmid maintenance system antidote protein VapI